MNANVIEALGRSATVIGNSVAFGNSKKDLRMKRETTEDRTASPSRIPLPWRVVAEYWRLVWMSCVVTFGPN